MSQLEELDENTFNSEKVAPPSVDLYNSLFKIPRYTLPLGVIKTVKKAAVGNVPVKDAGTQLVNDPFVLNTPELDTTMPVVLLIKKSDE